MARRTGRPPSTKEDLLTAKITALEKEFQLGFRMSPSTRRDISAVANVRAVIPDLTVPETVSLLDRWEGAWSYLTTLQWVRISQDGRVKPSNFPPNGDH